MPHDFWSNWAWPLATACIGAVFTGLLVWQWLSRRRRHQAAWAAGMGIYTIAAALEAWSERSHAWDPSVYRVYIVLAASLVGFLGLGTLYLVAHNKWFGHAYLGFVMACVAAFLAGTFTHSLLIDRLAPGITVGGQALGASLSFPRVMSLPLNITGSIFLFGGALYSVVRFVRRREFAYRVWANVLIAAGAGVLAFIGSRARLGDTTGLYPAEMFGAALMLAGFLVAGTLDKGRQVMRAKRAGFGSPPAAAR
jgi:hypothetical protein